MNRLQRYGLILFVLYFVFIGGSPYFAIPTVRYLHHVVMTLVLVGWLGWRFWHGKGIPASPLNTPLMLLIALAAISVLFSLDPRVSLEYLWFVLIGALSYWYIVNMFQHGKAGLAYEILFLGAFLVVFLSALQVGSALWGWGLHGSTTGWLNFIGERIVFPVERDLRIFLPVGVSTWTAGISAPLCVFAIVWALRQRRQAVRNIFIGLAVLLALVTLLTFSRGGWLSLGVSLCLLVLLRLVRTVTWDKRTMQITVGMTLAVLLVGVAIVASGVFARRQSGDAIRMDLWRSAVEMIQRDPLTGSGLGQFGRAYRELRSSEIADDRMATAHNLYLNAVTEMGVLVVVVMAWGLWAIVRSWWLARKDLPHDAANRVLLDGVFAALVGFLIQNLFDTMTFTFAMLLAAVMVVIITIPPSQSTLRVTHGSRWGSAFACCVMLGYGLWFMAIVDPSQRAFQASLAEDEQALEQARLAHDLDPALNLYMLQIAYLTGRDAYQHPMPEALEGAIAAYQSALMLEPTWDTGWMNLAVLHELDGNPLAALAAFDRARSINLRTPASIHWARIAEEVGTVPEAEIVDAYLKGLWQMVISRLPLSPFWMETPLRQQALTAFVAEMPLPIQVRILRVHQPDQVQNLIPEQPQTAQDWWVVGEVRLEKQDNQGAAQAFSEAIALIPHGDLFASRARAMIGVDVERALRDLEIARFLGTHLEFPSAIQLKLATSPEEIQRLRVGAVPFPVTNQSFEGVLYLSRTAAFRLFPQANFTSYGETIMQPWYDLAREYENVGEVEQAIRAYEFIRWTAYDEIAAQQALARLQP